ncbi:MAG: ROK family protein, partial [Acidimicrobiales bacterium]
SIDVGGTHLKASVLDRSGAMEVAPARVETTYPLPPEALVEALVALSAQLPPFDQVSVGFPGMVRNGRVLTAPHFVTARGPGTEEVPDLVRRWRGFDLAAALGKALSKPTKVDNDADQQGAAVVKGQGVELVITLGTGLGTALFHDGELMPHLEIAHQPFRKGQTYNEQIGDAARRRIGAKRWSKRVKQAVENLAALCFYDHLYVGGGNASRLTVDLGPDATIVDNASGILGGVKLWHGVGL